MTTDTKTPYSGLTPDVVFDAIETTGLRCDGRLLALNSYENRVEHHVGREARVGRFCIGSHGLL